jgi:SepF-like predicted cell division protein (DUF552 family)
VSSSKLKLKEKKMKNLILTGILMFSVNSFAAVSPYWDSVNRIEKALEAAGNVTISSVTSIVEVSDLKYEITSGFCIVTVQLTPVVSNHPSATQYTSAVVGQECNPN